MFALPRGFDENSAANWRSPLNNSKNPNQDSPRLGERWLAEHGDALYRYALQRVRSPDVAEDLVQETLLAALSAVSGFEEKSTERTWLIGILRHKFLDYLRKSVRQRPISELMPDDGYNPFDENGHWKIKVSAWRGDPLERLETAEFYKVLEDCLSKLPPRISQVFWLYEAESMETEAVCQELEITATNLWTILHRARLRLQRCLSLNWFETGGG
jgi:RNA polymerase sigma-70 factor (ECF subfamily)